MNVERRTCRAADGVRLVYSAAGAGETTLVFVHGGFANRGFWDAQLRAFAPRFRVLAPDLAGHGESGTDRERWGVPEFGADVAAVVEDDDATTGRARPVVLFGNSLGGPVAIEAALRLGARVLGVVGVDTFHDLERIPNREQARQRAEAFRGDLRGAVRDMTRMLFHQDADPALVAEVERQMARTPVDAAYRMLLTLGDYDLAAAARRLAAPLRTINGDLYPVDVAGVRRVVPGFEAVILPHTGHYPMLERPEVFHREVAAALDALVRP